MVDELKSHGNLHEFSVPHADVLGLQRTQSDLIHLKETASVWFAQLGPKGSKISCLLWAKSD